MAILLSLQKYNRLANVKRAEKVGSSTPAQEVTQCYQTTGGYDFILIVCVQDMQTYEGFVERVLHTNINIRKFQTAVSLRTVKHSTTIQL